MKAALTLIFTFLGIVVLYLGVKTLLQYRDATVVNYKYTNSEKGQIVTINPDSLQFIKNGNNYEIVSSNGEKLVLDSAKYGLNDFFSDWAIQGQNLIRPSVCKYISFVILNKKNSTLEDSLEYLSCSKTIDPELSTL